MSCAGAAAGPAASPNHPLSYGGHSHGRATDNCWAASHLHRHRRHPARLRPGLLRCGRLPASWSTCPWGCRGAWRNESPTGQESRSSGHRAAP